MKQVSSSANLFQAILTLKTEQEARQFFGDLLTKNEVDEFSKRWEAAQLLDSNVSYTQIIQKTGLSSTTVARIAKWLRGDLGGYRLVLNRIHSHIAPHSR